MQICLQLSWLRPSNSTSSMKTKEDPDCKNIIRNKKAFYEYQILDRIEAGISLLGTEVKSIRLKNVAFTDAFAHFKGDELFLFNLDIAAYTHGNMHNHDPKRPRKLLLRKGELRRLKAKINVKGLTLIPLRLYFSSRGWAKVELALAKGKANYDKRDAIKKRDSERDMRRGSY